MVRSSSNNPNRGRIAQIPKTDVELYAYLLVCDESVGTMVEISSFLNKNESVFLNWLTVLPHSFFIVSHRSATELTKVFRTFTKDQARFIILDVNTDRNGWLPKKAWDFINNPQSI
ncbi:hypothetical protein [Pseudanabaena yagii]|uniref:Uncharacterized protein n=1 Tax=Pseudanabaena yagii GIHE-NHR1 TaxID=2722753 RepID=A0ABX1LVA0_9CYAN|nr:hypothetical protein [Pseudanabaena yagii]NMF60107.1 hypothetical protein [Pseudanabaena yagii GIHE-NHR1]